MEGKQFFSMGKKLGMVLVFLFSSSILCLHGQEARPMVRRLTWQPVEYVSRYEVFVEILASTNENSSEWLEIIRKTSGTETYVDCLLFTGKYRIRVLSYDLVGNPGSSTEWVYFEVKAPPPAESPEETVKTETVVHSPPPPQAQGREGPEESEKSIFRLEALAAPLIILPFSDFNEIYSTSTVQPLGAALRFSVLPLVTGAGTFGIEILPAWNYLANDILHTSRYTHILGGHVSFVWQIRPFSRNTALDFRIGGGMTYISSRFVFNDGLDTDELDAWNPSLIGGISFVVFLNKSLFLDLGIDYYHIFTRDNMALNYLRPMIGIGCWF
jgi:hypothetical protein